MTVVDTSVWIDYFNDISTQETEAFDDLLGSQEILLGDLILTEVLQGFQQDSHFDTARKLLRVFPVVPMVGPSLALQSAQHYRTLRKRGVTVRKTIDVMIGTFCIAQDLPLLYSDRDFDPMVRYLGLRAVL
ncbi:MAG: PIN domain nuclease [Nitrospirales bacterium]|nr:PIN domain nuclease [Nitrospira sp.]MDR4501055.1 PIN domain nuclease [Nitrospirales bacterium]